MYLFTTVTASPTLCWKRRSVNYPDSDCVREVKQIGFVRAAVFIRRDGNGQANEEAWR